MHPGKIIVIEGADGTGKATTTENVIRLLRERQTFGSAKVLTASFPDYSSFYGKQVRHYLDGDNAHELVLVPPEMRADPFLSSVPYAEDRYWTYHTTMQPELSEGSIYLLDRYVTSNMAHQGAKLPIADRANFLARLATLEYEYFGIPIPDRVFLLELPEDVRSRRVNGRRQKAVAQETTGGQVGLSDIHEQDDAYMAAVAHEYHRLACAEGWDIVEGVRDGRELTPEEIAETILKRIVELVS